jgi:hypothetical protein
MKIYELTAIAARIFAICLFLYALRSFAGFVRDIGPASHENLTVSIFYFTGMVFIPAVIAAIIWKFPLTIARAFLPAIKTEEVRISDSNAFLPAALIVLGIYVLTYAVPDLLYHITIFYMVARGRSASMLIENPHESIATFIVTVLEIMIAFWLILGNAGIINIIRRIRGRPH